MGKLPRAPLLALTEAAWKQAGDHIQPAPALKKPGS